MSYEMEYCYTFEQMQELLKDSQGTPMAKATLARKIRAGLSPPFISPRRGVYWFPKDLFTDWQRSLQVTFPKKLVKNAS